MKLSALLFTLVFCRVIIAFGQTETTETHERGHWGVGVELGPCSGMYFLTGQANKSLNHGWCYANVGLTVTYKKYHFILQTGGISGSIQNDLSIGQEWKKDNNFGSVNLQLAAGYQLLNTKWFNIIPFVSGGATVFNTGPDVDNAKKTTSRWSPSYSIGSAFDFKVNFPVSKRNRFPGHEYVRQYLYLRLITGISPTYFDLQLDMKGAMYFVNLSIGGFYSGVREKRKN